MSEGPISLGQSVALLAGSGVGKISDTFEMPVPGTFPTGLRAEVHLWGRWHVWSESASPDRNCFEGTTTEPEQQPVEKAQHYAVWISFSPPHQSL